MIEYEGQEYIIVDGHVHMGQSTNMQKYGAGTGFFYEDLIKRMDKNKVDKVCAFPVANPHTDYSKDNEKVIEAMEKNPDRILAFARIQPYFQKEALKDIERYVGLGIKGLKLHPRVDGGYNANCKDLVYPLIEAAQSFNLPVLFHTGGAYNCSCGLVADLARNFPKVNIIMAHMGYMDSYHEAIAFTKSYSNLWVDTSYFWPPTLIKKAVQEVGSEKILFGSDTPYLTFEAELNKVLKYSDLDSEEIRCILGKNMMGLLNIAV